MSAQGYARLGQATCLAIVGFYVVLGLIVLSPESVYSGDIGVKYVQAQALVDQRFTSLDIPYPGEFLDPQREFFPLRRPFIIKARGTTQAIFPPASAVVQAVAVAFFGFRGFIGFSILAAAIVLIASMALAPVRLRWAVAVAMGLAGPLWFYAVSGWEHAPAIALSTAAFAVALRSSMSIERTAVIAGALLGAGAALRDEVLLLGPGLLLVVWLRHRAWRPVLTAILGVAVPLFLAAAVEVWWFNRPAAAHLRHAVHLLQTALRITSGPNPEVPVLEPMTMRDRYLTVVTYWLLGRGSDLQVGSFVATFLAALFIRWRWRSSLGLLAWVIAIGVTAIPDVREVLTAPKWLAGLIRLAPYVVFAFVPLAPSLVADDERLWVQRLRGAVVFATLAFLVLAFAGVDTTGGKSLGPRLLLPIVPLVTVSAIIGIASYVTASAVVDRLLGWAGVALVAAALAIHIGGTIPAYKYRNTDDSSAVRAAGGAPDRIVVADDMYTAQLLFPLYDKKIILLADTVESGQRLGAVLAAGQIGSAVLVSRNLEPVVMLPPMRLDRSEQRGRTVLQYWRR
jgi:hypothetical protein